MGGLYRIRGWEGRHDGRGGRPESLSERASPRFLPHLRTFSAGPRNDGVEGVGLGAGVRDGSTVWGHRSLDPSRASGLAALPQGNHEGLPLRGDGFRLGGWDVGGDGRAHLGEGDSRIAPTGGDGFTCRGTVFMGEKENTRVGVWRGLGHIMKSPIT